jgi:hypothetical protein
MVRGVARQERTYGEWTPADEAPTLPFLHRVVAWQGPPPPFVPTTWGMTIEWLRILAAAQASGRRLKPVPGHVVHRGGRGRPRSGGR